jgi:hypothetical protein
MPSLSDVIRDWMARIIIEGRLGPYEELHVDRIDFAWRNHDRWTAAAEQAFALAIEERSAKNLPVTVAMIFSLQQSQQSIASAEDLTTAQDHSPPSLLPLQS